jgi:hypothetical protein
MRFSVVRPDGQVVHMGSLTDCRSYIRNVKEIWGISRLRIIREGGEGQH